MSCKQTRILQIIILSAHVSRIADNAISILEMVTSLNSNESNNINFSSNVSTFCIANLLLGNIFCMTHKYKSFVKVQYVMFPVRV